MSEKTQLFQTVGAHGRKGDAADFDFAGRFQTLAYQRRAD
jgi:hypothetical protein